jgi:hypothetical protein
MIYWPYIVQEVEHVLRHAPRNFDCLAILREIETKWHESGARLRVSSCRMWPTASVVDSVIGILRVYIPLSWVDR